MKASSLKTLEIISRYPEGMNGADLRVQCPLTQSTLGSLSRFGYVYMIRMDQTEAVTDHNLELWYVTDKGLDAITDPGTTVKPASAVQDELEMLRKDRAAAKVRNQKRIDKNKPSQSELLPRTAANDPEFTPAQWEALSIAGQVSALESRLKHAQDALAEAATYLVNECAKQGVEIE